MPEYYIRPMTEKYFPGFVCVCVGGGGGRATPLSRLLRLWLGPRPLPAKSGPVAIKYADETLSGENIAQN